MTMVDERSEYGALRQEAPPDAPDLPAGPTMAPGARGCDDMPFDAADATRWLIALAAGTRFDPVESVEALACRLGRRG